MTSKYNVCEEAACPKGSLEPGKQQVLFLWLCAVPEGSPDVSPCLLHSHAPSFKPDMGDQALRM